MRDRTSQCEQKVRNHQQLSVSYTTKFEFPQSFLNLYNRMKNRYKVLIIVICFLGVCALAAILIGLGFHKVGLAQYGYAQNRIFGSVSDTTVFTPGNYFIGIDQRMLLYPKGLISYEFNVSANTLDISFLTVETLFLGQFLPSQLSYLNLNYGHNYEQMLRYSIQSSVRETLEKYTLVQILQDRAVVEGEVYSQVRQSIRSTFPFIKCETLSLGTVGVDLPNSAVMTQNPALYQLQADVMEKTYNITKEVGFLTQGTGLLLEYEQFHGSLFSEVIGNISTILGSYGTLNNTQKAYGAMYMMSNSLMRGVNLDKIEIHL